MCMHLWQWRAGRNSKQIQMTKNQNSKQYDLEDRTLKFAKNVRLFVKKLRKTIGNMEKDRNALIKKATELMNIFGATLRKSL